MAKNIYTFIVEKPTQIEEKREEKYIDDGVEKTRWITENVEKTVPIEFALRQPNRRQVQEAECIYSIEMSKAIRQGILTKAMLLNKYKDVGGLVSEKDSQELTEKYREVESLTAEVVSIKSSPPESRTPEQAEQLLKLESSILSLRKEIILREMSYLDLFNHTADTRAQNRSILWYILHLSFYKDPTKNHKDFVPFFEGKTFEEKENYLVELEESADWLYNEVNHKLVNVFNFWFFSEDASKEDYDKIVNSA